MTQGETIMDMQKRFTYIINHLKGLGKTFVEEEVNVKVLKPLNRKWQPTMTTITESKNLAQMSSAKLFGKLIEYEMDMSRMVDEEQKDRKAKGLALKTKDTASETDTSCCNSESDEEDLNLMVRKFKKFMIKKNNKKRFNQSKKGFKKNESSSSKVTCCKCGKFRHFRSDCPNLKKHKSNEQRRYEHEEKKKDKFIKKKAYIA
ncbi:hypothetical protein Fmac_005814 [Flemingia macrophylla]|uniref:CCHC-type domain-containing protein n=1 Tax=Flemingia macrophylla TaxID=520843 RepID=A0ABD1N8V1_9FABA